MLASRDTYRTACAFAAGTDTAADSRPATSAASAPERTEAGTTPRAVRGRGPIAGSELVAAAQVVLARERVHEHAIDLEVDPAQQARLLRIRQERALEPVQDDALDLVGRESERAGREREDR